MMVPIPFLALKIEINQVTTLRSRGKEWCFSYFLWGWAESYITKGLNLHLLIFENCYLGPSCWS
jgi:hypothetical protein